MRVRELKKEKKEVIPKRDFQRQDDVRRRLKKYIADVARYGCPIRNLGLTNMERLLDLLDSSQLS